MLLRPHAQKTGLFNLLFEFKQIPLGDVREKPTEEGNQTGKKHKKKGKPLTDEQVREWSREKLLADIPAIAEAMDGAKGQLRSYQQTLYRLYGQELKQASYAVVSVGFGRIIFEKID